ncbi:MAG: type ISP restriction/modification enzyme [Chitinophagaceae bacterium]
MEVTAENAQRIKRQNERKISVVIGNPPYNANQANENDNNKNREYHEIDKRIKETYVKKSTAQKTKVYDMYARFYRWASDRIMDDGIICLISNNSFINARGFDGFRKSIQDEYQTAYIIDLGGNIRELSGKDGIFLNEKHTIFGEAAAVGIAIAFLVKDKKRRLQHCHINYIHPTDIRATRIEKIEFIQNIKFDEIPFESIQPDKNNNWINLSDNDWDNFISIGNKDVKNNNSKEAIFESFSLGVATNRDEWVYDLNKEHLAGKVKFFCDAYSQDLEKWNSSNKEMQLNDFVDRRIKWTSELENYLKKNTKVTFDAKNIRKSSYRPFTKQFLYFDRIIIHRPYQNEYYFGLKQNFKNKLIAINTNGKEFNTLSTDLISNNHFNGDSQCLPFYRYTSTGERSDNITDWAVEQFMNQYATEEKWKYITKEFVEYDQSKYSSDVVTPPTIFSGITKENIFHYVYAVLHNPAYRKKYELNLKREFPRIPFYDNFYQWVKWGEQLMDLHINYETAAPYPLNVIARRNDEAISDGNSNNEIASSQRNTKSNAPRNDVRTPKPKLKALKDIGVIVLDDNTELHGVPKEAWEYKLGNRSALEWILDQYKEKKPSDPTIGEKFNTYKFADYKEQVIDLLKRVCTVSVETMKIVKEMEKINIEK